MIRFRNSKRLLLPLESFGMIVYVCIVVIRKQMRDRITWIAGDAGEGRVVDSALAERRRLLIEFLHDGRS